MIYTAKVSMFSGCRSFKSATVRGIKASSLMEASNIAITEYSKHAEVEDGRVILNSIWHDYPQPSNKDNVRIRIEK